MRHENHNTARPCHLGCVACHYEGVALDRAESARLAERAASWAAERIASGQSVDLFAEFAVSA